MGTWKEDKIEFFCIIKLEEVQSFQDEFIMTNLKQYNHKVGILFNDYFQNLLELEEFIQKLRAVEDLYWQTFKYDTTENTMWFKFSDDDTLVIRIDDLERDLSNANRDITLERMREAINLDNELFIHYS